MANATLSHPGAINNTSDGSFAQDNALFEEIFAGEVLTAFEETNVFSPLHMTRQIDHGKSAKFPATWKFTSRYHVPGTPVLGSNQMNHNDITILVDDLLLSDVFLDSLEELKTHYDVRSIYSTEIGRALGKSFDEKLARIMYIAARASANVSGGDGGTTLTNADAATDGEVLAGLYFNAAQVMDEKDIPDHDRYSALKPVQWYMLAQTLKVQNKDYGGPGWYLKGDVPVISGIEIVKSNHLPNGQNIASAVEGENNDYTGDFTNSVAPVWQKTAAATVKLMDIATQTTAPDGDFSAMYQGVLLLAKMAVGHGVLRPECAVEIATA